MDPSAQSALQKLKFGSISQKTGKNKYQISLALFNFTRFLNLVWNILPGILGSRVNIVRLTAETVA